MRKTNISFISTTMGTLSIYLVFILAVSVNTDHPCVPRDYGNGGTVCVCNATYCDTVNKPGKVGSNKYIVYTSNKAGLRFKKEIKNFNNNSNFTDTFAFIDNQQQFQSIFGFGGAFTDSAGINILNLTAKARANLLKSYFSNQGIEYSLCRVPLGGSDYSTRAYSYDDTVEPDPSLSHFALQPEDLTHKIPLIKQALSLTGNKLNLFASAWTAPKWMKTNGQYSGLGFIKSKYLQTWANYFIKFLDEYKKRGVIFWGITTGNEPSNAYATVFPLCDINTVAWTPSGMGNWIGNNLGPALKNSQHSGIQLITFDDSRYIMFLLEITLNNSKADAYVDGIGIHWYTNKFSKGDLQEDFHNLHPNVFILNTEACEGTNGTAQLLGSWQRGENYARDILMNLHYWSTGWVDWNMALNTMGGPTYINNFVDSPIIVNASAGEFYKQPMYYALGHFSKFIPPGSTRIDSPTRHDKLKLVAFIKPDSGTVVVILNTRNYSIPLTLTDNSDRNIYLDITAYSFTTVLYW